MRIGNTHIPPTSGVDGVGRSGRGESQVRSGARMPAEDTADLLALSAGVRLRAALESDNAGRQALVDELARAWNAGAYRPDANRLADKLLDWGFDGDTTQIP